MMEKIEHQLVFVIGRCALAHHAKLPAGIIGELITQPGVYPVQGKFHLIEIHKIFVIQGEIHGPRIQGGLIKWSVDTGIVTQYAVILSLLGKMFFQAQAQGQVITFSQHLRV